MLQIIAKIQEELKQNSDLQTKASGERFFKEAVKIYGVKTAIVTKIAKKYDSDILAMQKSEVFALCDELWQSGYMEESFIACHYAYLIREIYKPDDFNIFEKWVNNYVSNWAACDSLCNHSIGSFVDKYPQFLESLKKWTRSDNRWTRRAAAVTLIIPARNGKFLKEVFEIANNLLMDSEDLVQKGYGWLLKAASQAHQKEVFEYVIKNKAQMPRTALRYAIEKMPKDLRTKAMEK
ncbi:MAG: DNA alkylation repair enzyme [Actinobacteria bacterium ADurb.Bin346]|nr:MAG: DNA alkylation repair enzyme [Actinobacteria bacterium ADurb.Bin346]